MSEKEIARASMIERVIDKRISQKEAALKLDLTPRHLRRLIEIYRREGAPGLVSRKRGVPSNRKTSETVMEVVRDFVKDPHMEGFGPTFMAEKLEELKGICLSKETVRKTMMEEGIWEAETRKPIGLHLTRPRKRGFGEMVQIDGSEHRWLEDRAEKAVLLVFIDDATSAILAAKFVPVESYFNYGALCKDYFRQYGLPKSFYSDRFSVFRVNKGKKDSVTQFQRAMNVLGIDLICASSPQAKGRVERANGTLQDRLIKEMRLRGISHYEDANRYLPEFLADYNRRFAVQPASNKDYHHPLDQDLDLDFLFAIHDFRIISRALQISYDGKLYQVATRHSPWVYVREEVLITEFSTGDISAWHHGSPLMLEEIEKRPKRTAISSSKDDKTVVTPKYDHPWRSYGKKLNGKPILTTMIVE